MRALILGLVLLTTPLLSASLPRPPGTPATFASTSWLVTEAGERVTLATVAGGAPIAVLVIKGVHCRVCTAELERVAKRAAELEQLGVKVVAVSADAPAKHAKLKRTLDLPFPVFTDEDGALVKSQGSWMSETSQPLPGVWWLDRCGEIAERYEGRWPGRVQTQMIIDGLRRLSRARTCGLGA